MTLPLTDEQKLAATAGEQRVFIEASPGSGKTTVATERYGVARFDNSTSAGRGVYALSFARSARGELHRRVRRRWGTDAMRWPHRVWTLDALHYGVLRHLLHTGAVTWPGGHRDLIVLDTWRGMRGSRPLEAGAFSYRTTLQGDQVRALRSRRQVGGTFFTSKSDYMSQLEAGCCTHDEVRHVLQAALRRDSPLRTPLRGFFRHSMRSLIVDEIFDGNIVDLQMVMLASLEGVPTTLIGDPWQALYAFRGARPLLVPQLVDGQRFSTYRLSTSFRFDTQQTRDAATRLRSGLGVTIATAEASDVDVVLATKWKSMWNSSETVLPISFGQPRNRTDAAVALLLEHVTSRHFSELPASGPDAAVILGLEPDEVRATGGALFRPILDLLRGNREADAEAALSILRETLSEMSGTAIRRLAAPNEARQVERLIQLGRRLGRRDLVPGLTVHQAKGCEWPMVGLVLTEAEAGRLAEGLEQDREEDRVLYVAATRARERVVRL